MDSSGFINELFPSPATGFVKDFSNRGPSSLKIAGDVNYLFKMTCADINR